MNITPGTVFSTKLPDGSIVETGCIAQTAPDEFGNFDGIDSDGVEVTFNTQMVAHIDCDADPRLWGSVERCTRPATAELDETLVCEVHARELNEEV